MLYTHTYGNHLLARGWKLKDVFYNALTCNEALNFRLSEIRASFILFAIFGSDQITLLVFDSIQAEQTPVKLIFWVSTWQPASSFEIR